MGGNSWKAIERNEGVVGEIGLKRMNVKLVSDDWVVLSPTCWQWVQGVFAVGDCATVRGDCCSGCKSARGKVVAVGIARRCGAIVAAGARVREETCIQNGNNFC